MMHEREKSDPAVVAVKLANKAERSAAELVEPRAGAEGNASQHSTDRAQNRVTVSQALERIRGKQQGKGRRISSLRCSTTSARIFSNRRSLNSKRTRPREWMG